MKAWTIIGHGRERNATGIFYSVREAYTAATAADALEQHKITWERGHRGPWVAVCPDTGRAFALDSYTGEMVTDDELVKRLGEYRKGQVQRGRFGFYTDWHWRKL